MDQFHGRSDSVSHPARRTRAAVPNDIAPIPEIGKALYVGASGDVRLRALGDAEPTLFRNVPAGAILPIRVAQIFASATTAADFVVLL